MDIATAYDLNDSVEIFGRIDNLFDRDYEPVRGYNGAERAFNLGVKGNF